MIDWTTIAEAIGQAGGRRVDPRTPRAVGGGCINEAYRLDDGAQGYFVKLNSRDRLAMFEAEAAGLEAMAGTETIRVPRPLCTGTTDGQSYLVMEYIPLGGHTADGPAEAGRRLAAMHRASRPDFGWDRDNTIGATPQPNHPRTTPSETGSSSGVVTGWDSSSTWPPATDTAPGSGSRANGCSPPYPPCSSITRFPPCSTATCGAATWASTRTAIRSSSTRPSTMGDREADIAMTELFGGFGGDFYAAYTETWPLDPGYRTRKDLYNLYHILNHLNLFGTGYLGQAQGLIQRLLAQIH